MRRRPVTVIMVAFATGSTTIQANYTAAEVRAMFTVSDFDSDGDAEIITLKSIQETLVKEDPRSEVVQYILKDEEISFRKKDVVFWSVSVAYDPPVITEVKRGPLIIP